MASTITLTGDWLVSLGNRRQVFGTGNLGVYANPNGVAVTPTQVGLGVIESMLIYPAAGYTFEYVASTGKIKAYRSAALAPTVTMDSYTPAGSVAAPAITPTPGTQIISVSYQNLKAADADVADSATVDQVAGPSNDDYIDTYAAVAGGAWAYTENAEIDAPRNVEIGLLNDTGGGIVMEEGDLLFQVTGTFRGAAQTDDITFTFTAGTKTIGNAPNYRWKYGVKPFDHVTSVVATGLTANQNGLKIGVGIGRLLGLPQDPDSGTNADILKVTKNSVDVAAGTWSAVNKTLDQGAISADDDFDIDVKVDVAAVTGTASAPAFTGTPATLTGSISAIAQAALAEVTNGVNLAGVTFSFVAVGY